MVDEIKQNDFDIYWMGIISLTDGYYFIRISTNEFSTFLRYNPLIKELKLANDSSFDKILLKNEYQLKKTLNIGNILTS